MSFLDHYDVEIALRAAEIHVRDSNGEHMIKLSRSNYFGVSRVVIVSNRCLGNDNILSKSLKNEIGKHDNEKQDEKDRHDSACESTIGLFLFVPLQGAVREDIAL